MAGTSFGPKYTFEAIVGASISHKKAIKIPAAPNAPSSNGTGMAKMIDHKCFFQFPAMAPTGIAPQPVRKQGGCNTSGNAGQDNSQPNRSIRVHIISPLLLAQLRDYHHFPLRKLTVFLTNCQF